MHSRAFHPPHRFDVVAGLLLQLSECCLLHRLAGLQSALRDAPVAAVLRDQEDLGLRGDSRPAPDEDDAR